MISPGCPHLDDCIHTSLLCLFMVVEALVIAVAPLRLSSALDDLKERLSDTRCNSPELHAQLQAVETVLNQANGGRGWGIKVCRGVVLHKDLLQATCIRAALVATAVLAFLDSHLGFEKAMGEEHTSIQHVMERENAIEAEMSSIRHMLINMTMLIQNRK